MERALELQQARMRELAQEAGNTVYEYTNDAPQRGATPEQALKLAHAAVAYRQGAGRTLGDDAAREALLAGPDGPLMRDFARDYPTAFRLVTEKERGPEHFSVLVRLGRFAAGAAQNGVPVAEATAQVHSMLQGHCARGPA